jgi:NAD(P)-dependent dehydrogenase (short-subunit alcohol dehydrogenase family)
MPNAEVIVVTGASAGLVRAAAAELARGGARVALLARGRAGLEGAAREVERAGGQALVIPTDVADPDQVEAAAERVEAELGPIDIWINGAMVTVYSPVKDMSPAEIRRVTEVTYLGAVHGTLAALARMLPRDRGTIVQVGSALAYRSIPLQSAYCGAKHALRGFTNSLRSELIHDRSNVRLVMVQLAGFNTPQFQWGRVHIPKHPQPLPPYFQPEVAARGIAWAARHPRRRELWVGYPAVKAIVGERLAPWLGDRILAKEAYEGQMTDRAIASDRPDNLYEPAEGDYGTHGPFDEGARTRSAQLWAATHRTATLGIGAAVAVLIAVLALL